MDINKMNHNDTQFNDVSPYIYIVDDMDHIVHPIDHEDDHCYTTIFHDDFCQKLNQFKNSSQSHCSFQKLTCFQNDDELYDGLLERISINHQYLLIICLYKGSYLNICKEQMEQFHSQLLIGQLASGYVHEIRNPLTSIKGFIQLLQAGIKQEEQYYKVMIAEIDKIEYITNQLLQIGKPINRQTKHEECFISMLEEVIKLFHMNMNMRNIHFHIELEQPISILCNRMQIKQALINLVKNAAEAMEYQGNIYFTGHLHVDGYYIFQIKDEGPGIPKEIVDHIGKPVVSTKQKGTGLGLKLTKEMIEKNNGEMTITQNSEQGTCITIKFLHTY